MQNEFPIANKTNFEEIYGKSTVDAQPIKNSNSVNIFDAQEVNCFKPHRSDSIFHDERKKEIERIILENHNPPNYLSLSKLIQSDTNLTQNDYKLNEIIEVYRELELKKVINNKAVSKERVHEAASFSKIETLKLLEALDKFGDDWSSVESCVGRSKAECILHFLKLDMKITKLLHPNRRLSDVIFLTSRVHPSVGGAAAKEALDLKRIPNFSAIISKAIDQLNLEEKKLDRLNKVATETIKLRIKEKINDFRNLLISLEKEKNDIKEDIIDYEKDIRELSDVIKELKNNC